MIPGAEAVVKKRGIQALRIFLHCPKPGLVPESGATDVEATARMKSRERHDCFEQMSNVLAVIVHFVGNKRLGKREYDETAAEVP